MPPRVRKLTKAPGVKNTDEQKTQRTKQLNQSFATAIDRVKPIDMEAEMLNALINENTCDIPEVVSIEEQKRALMRLADTLPTEDKIDIGRVLVARNESNYLKKCAEGTIINLDALSEESVLQMYNMLTYKLTKRQSE